MGRVRIGTCSGPADAALVKAAFEAHQIPLLINAEQHASMLAGLGGAFVPLHIYVDETHAEAASELLEDLRAKDRDPTTEAEREADAEDDRELAAVAVERSERRRRHGTVLVILLAGAVGAQYVIDRPVVFALLVVACVGGIVFTLRNKPSPLPSARIRR